LPLSPGDRLGPYEIVAKLGEGGMGEVYRARDQKLGRDVAIKVLPADVAADTERLARFKREAQVLASLNHPNIAAIYGLDEADDKPFLVLELVEGEDLAERLKRGPVPTDEALEIAKQIALALEDAHEKGIVHRDLKPANIKVRPDGVVKVLDFGLAKALAPEVFSGKPDTMNSPTLTTPAMTRAGMIMGTAAYMSPEQARGKTVDKRADVWAFGAVLFEMLTGERAFQGEAITDTIVSVITKEPSWPKLPAATSAGLRRLLARCLRKDPKARLQSIGEARVRIEELLGGASEDVAAAVSLGDASLEALPRSAWSRALPWALAASTLGLAIALVLVWAPWRSDSSPRSSRSDSRHCRSSRAGNPAPCGPRTVKPWPSERGRRPRTRGRSTCAIWIRRWPPRSPTLLRTHFQSPGPRPAGSCSDPTRRRRDSGRSPRWAASRSHFRPSTGSLLFRSPGMAWPWRRCARATMECGVFGSTRRRAWPRSLTSLHRLPPETSSTGPR
jgi:serine/threonine protein kinase